MWFETIDFLALIWTLLLGSLAAGTSTNFRNWGSDSAGAGHYGGILIFALILSWIGFAAASGWRYGFGHGAWTLGYCLVLFVVIFAVFDQMETTRKARWKAKLAADKAAEAAGK